MLALSSLSLTKFSSLPNIHTSNIADCTFIYKAIQTVLLDMVPYPKSRPMSKPTLDSLEPGDADMKAFCSSNVLCALQTQIQSDLPSQRTFERLKLLKLPHGQSSNGTCPHGHYRLRDQGPGPKTKWILSAG